MLLDKGSAKENENKLLTSTTHKTDNKIKQNKKVTIFNQFQ